MDKKLTKIRDIVDNSGLDFFQFLDGIFNDDLKAVINELQYHSEVYLFSGIIRNYFLNIKEHRDVDLVLSKEVDVARFFNGFPIKRNSFGGFKIQLDSVDVDLWFMKNTWAFQYGQKTLDLQLEKKIPDTAFFNFSSVIYCINSKRFFYTDHFLRFLRDKKLDYVDRINANYGLCVVNTFYYADKYSLKVSERLLKLIREFHTHKKYDYQSIQLKHFGKVLYDDLSISNRLDNNIT